MKLASPPTTTNAIFQKDWESEKASVSVKFMRILIVINNY